jgi:hypothetical protein
MRLLSFPQVELRLFFNGPLLACTIYISENMSPAFSKCLFVCVQGVRSFNWYSITCTRPSTVLHGFVHQEVPRLEWPDIWSLHICAAWAPLYYDGDIFKKLNCPFAPINLALKFSELALSYVCRFCPKQPGNSLQELWYYFPIKRPHFMLWLWEFSDRESIIVRAYWTQHGLLLDSLHAHLVTLLSNNNVLTSI